MIKSLGVQYSFQEQTDLKSSIAVTVTGKKVLELLEVPD